jgi:adenine-specific DNA-methyltransferase
VLLQRTTAKEQQSRLVAAELPAQFVREHGAVVIENHLNMIRPINSRPAVSAGVLAKLLNNPIVDQAFRCLSGSVAVSAYELESLPLPSPEMLLRLLAGSTSSVAIREACTLLYGPEGGL